MTDYAPALVSDDGRIGAATRVRLRLVPRASATALAGLVGDAVKLRVAAPPVDGKANAVALAHLADVLGVRARDLHITSGATSRTKVVRVDGLAVGEVARRLAAAG